MRTGSSERFGQRLVNALEKAGTSEGARKAWLKRQRAKAQQLLDAAESLAEAAHEGQTRAYGLEDEPYIVHPRQIAARVMDRPDATPEMVAAAYLHDVVEDTDVTLDEIATATSPAVAELVGWLTDEFTHEAFPDLNRKARKKLEHERLSQAPHPAKVLKLLDRLSNLGTMQGAKPGFQRLYADESESILEALAGTDDNLEAEMRAAITQLRAWADEA
jgi:(p)ppGpp synthase/HD superfamily hydrolase